MHSRAGSALSGGCEDGVAGRETNVHRREVRRGKSRRTSLGRRLTWRNSRKCWTPRELILINAKRRSSPGRCCMNRTLRMSMLS